MNTYQKPIIGECYFKSVALLATGGVLTDLAKDNICRTYENNIGVPAGTYTVFSNFILSADSCEIDGDISFSVLVTDTVIIPNCDTLVVDCVINSSCTTAPHEVGTLMVNSAIINGEDLLGGTPIEIPIDDPGLIQALFEEANNGYCSKE